MQQLCFQRWGQLIYVVYSINSNTLIGILLQQPQASMFLVAGTAEANNGSGTVTSVMCSDDFFFDGSGCQPECGEWEEWSSLTVKTIDGIVIVVVSLGVIAAAVTLVVSCVQHKRM